MKILPIAVVALALAAPARAAWEKPSVLCNIADDRIGEASGIAMSRVNPGIFYVQNDGGDTARVFAIDKAGKTAAVISVTNATNADWEDIAVGYDKDCKPTLYIGDLGGNNSGTNEYTVYAIPDARIEAGDTARNISVEAQILRFKYPDGAHDAETLMADWKGRALYVVTKEFAPKASGVYRLDPVFNGTVQTAAKVGTMTFADPLPIYPNMATGGDIAPDGSRMVVRTYQMAYEWTIPKDKAPDDVLAQKPKSQMLMLERQGEAICYGLDGKTWLTTSEQRPTPVYQYKWKPETK
jgi:hypothetical protein